MWCCSEMGRYPVASFPRNWEAKDFALSSMAGESFALSRESLFFACAKKSNQKKAHPGGAPSALRAAGPQAGPEFSEGTSMCRPKTARIVRAALRVLPDLLAAPQGARISKSNSQGQSQSQSQSHRDLHVCGPYSLLLDSGR